MELSVEERARAAAALEELLQQMAGGQPAGSPGQTAYIAGDPAGVSELGLRAMAQGRSCPPVAPALRPIWWGKPTVYGCQSSL